MFTEVKILFFLKQSLIIFVNNNYLSNIEAAKAFSGTLTILTIQIFLQSSNIVFA